MPELLNMFNLDEIMNNVSDAFNNIAWQDWGTAALCLIIGFLFAGFASSMTGRILSRYTSVHYTQIIKRTIYYAILVIFILFAISTLQLNVKVLGIATLVTVAIGFASQTAVSNIISGLFLVFERPFSIGDELELNGVRGTLLSIDLLSIKLQTLQNTLIRIPNESLLKSQFINLTKFPIRRLDTAIVVDWSNDLNKVKSVLTHVAAQNQQILESPAPQLLFDEFNDRAMRFVFAVWVKKEAFSVIRSSLPCQIQQAFLENNIRIPMLEVTLAPQPPA